MTQGVTFGRLISSSECKILLLLCLKTKLVKNVYYATTGSPTFSVSQWTFSTLPSFQHMWNRKWKDVGPGIGRQAPFTQVKRQNFCFDLVFTSKRLKTERYENRLERSVSETPPHPLSCKRKVECFQQCWAHTMPEELSNSVWTSSRRPCVGFIEVPMTKVFSMFITATCWLGMHTTAWSQIILDMSSPACKQNCFAMNLENVAM